MGQQANILPELDFEVFCRCDSTNRLCNQWAPMRLLETNKHTPNKHYTNTWNHRCDHSSTQKRHQHNQGVGKGRTQPKQQGRVLNISQISESYKTGKDHEMAKHKCDHPYVLAHDSHFADVDCLDSACWTHFERCPAPAAILQKDYATNECPWSPLERNVNTSKLQKRNTKNTDAINAAPSSDIKKTKAGTRCFHNQHNKSQSIKCVKSMKSTKSLQMTIDSKRKN